MAESAQVAKKTAASAKRKPRPRPTAAVQFTVWAMNGDPLPEDLVERFAAAIQEVQVEMFNEGVRILTQINKG